MADLADEDHPAGGLRGARVDAVAWASIPRSPTPWRAGRSRCRGPGRSPSGPTCSRGMPRRRGPDPARRRRRRRRPGALAALAEEDPPRPRAPTATAATGSLTGACGWPPPWRGGKLDGDLTGRCAAALQQVLDSLGRKPGRTPRRRPALPRRPRRSLPPPPRRRVPADRAGQPARLHLHRASRLPRWRGCRATAVGTSGYAGTAGGRRDGPVLPGPARRRHDLRRPPGPIVTGRVDHDLLHRLAAHLTRSWRGHSTRNAAPTPARTSHPAPAAARAAEAARRTPATAPAPGSAGPPPRAHPGQRRRPALRTDRTRVLAPHRDPHRPGRLDQPAPRRRRRHRPRPRPPAPRRHYPRPALRRPRLRPAPRRLPIHHIIPRSQGGATKLTNLLLLCTFHHLILIHRWGWTITLNADGTTTATSPTSHRVLHSHSRTSQRRLTARRNCGVGQPPTRSRWRRWRPAWPAGRS